MTTKELIELLQSLDPIGNRKVFLSTSAEGDSRIMNIDSLYSLEDDHKQEWLVIFPTEDEAGFNFEQKDWV